MRIAYWHYPCTTQPVRAALEETIQSVTAGSMHVCALTRAGRALCWGDDGLGQLGRGTQAGTLPWDSVVRGHGSAMPAPVVGDHVFAALEAAGEHTCGLTTAGEVYCWGGGLLGPAPLTTTDACAGAQIARGDGYKPTPCALAPVRIPTSVRLRAIATSAIHACGLDEAGTAWCWGMNNAGQLGDGTRVDRPEPVRVTVPRRPGT
ncbi:MAG: hypothetical protein FIB01_09485 [Gemmatimonadetes bacterium]|nr:hypothetical protein [Gemmatimonadota bacterium]